MRIQRVSKTPSDQDQDTAHRGYGDKWASSAYIGVSVWQFIGWTKAGILPRGFPLTPGGKLFWSFRALDAAMDRAARSRKPRREHRGIVKERLLRRRMGGREALVAAAERASDELIAPKSGAPKPEAERRSDQVAAAARRSAVTPTRQRAPTTAATAAAETVSSATAALANGLAPDKHETIEARKETSVTASTIDPSPAPHAETAPDGMHADSNPSLNQIPDDLSIPTCLKRTFP